ncbi:MAG: M23 family metallopeptidase [Candidatus Rokubacteria bacterium]|nr:M23 family metallopeptidase [Candidatus Rokubacteria bacterium]
MWLVVALVWLASTADARAEPSGRLAVVVHPARLSVGDVGWLHVRGAGDAATVEGSVGERSLTFFRYAGGHAAVVGIDLETRPGTLPWRVATLGPGREPRIAHGRVKVSGRSFPVQRLTLPERMVDLEPETERRAVAETERLRMLFRTISGERLWRGRFTRPVAGTEPGTGFGARRIINGRPRMPHSGIDFSAGSGTPVVAANAGRVALVAHFFFPGRLVAIDHGLGLYTLYFHLEHAIVTEDERVGRGQTIGAVGATGRATGPHLHFAAQVGSARIDPAGLLGLSFRD